MKNSEPSNPEPRFLWHTQGGHWVVPWNYAAGGGEYQGEYDGSLNLLAWLFFWFPPLCLFLLWKAQREGRKQMLARVGYRKHGPDATRYGLWQEHPTTKRWVLTQPLT